MNYSLSLGGALIGAFIGSFFNVIAIRTVDGKSWWGKERSRCPHCDHLLTGPDLIPIISWLMLRGKCRYCGEQIGLKYPVSEFIFALWGFAAMAKWGLTPAGLFALTGGWMMMINAMTDLYSGYVYDHLALSLVLVGLSLRLFGGLSPFLSGLYGSLAGFSLIAVIIFLSRGGMGWGDANIMAGAGAFLGWKLVLLGAYIGFMIGGFTAIALLILKKVGRKDSVPLVPFLTAGILCAMIWGSLILSKWDITSNWPW